MKKIYSSPVVRPIEVGPNVMLSASEPEVTMGVGNKNAEMFETRKKGFDAWNNDWSE